MKLAQTRRFRAEFFPFLSTKKGQAAFMQLPPGGTSDDDVSNEHPRSEQWLFVVAGLGTAVVVSKEGTRRKVKLGRGSLLVIEQGELHQIKNSGQKPFVSINFYLPPAYRSDGRLRRRSSR